MNQDQQRSEVDAGPVDDDTVSVVEEVIESVQALDGAPVEDHVAVFEQAHERLRRALDDRRG